MAIIRYLLLIILLIGSFCTHADCHSTSSTASFGNLSSFTLASTPQTVQAGSGFACSGSLLSLLSSNTIQATLASSMNASGTTPRLFNSITGDGIPYVICKDATCSSSYAIGNSISWSSPSLLGLLGLFNSSDGTLPLYFKTQTGSNIAAGTYTDTITLNWNYHICFIGIAGLCFYTDGTGTSTVTITMTVSNDCYIDNAPDVNFGSQAIPSAFPDITSALSVRCTKKATYTVNLASVNPTNDNWRQMAATLNGTTNYLQYQLYQPDGSAWGPQHDYSATGSGGSQTINYTAKINPAQNNKPAGRYSDVITVTVTY